MKLLYLWVQKYSLFDNREFHFSDEYHFHFNQETQILDCQYNDRYPAMFDHTQNVNSISCIIGNNGQGKTTLLRLLMTILPYKGGLSGFNPLPCIYALKADDDVTGDIYVYTSLEQIRIQAHHGVNVKNSQNFTISRMEMDSGNFLRCKEMAHTAVIFHSNIFDRDRYNMQDTFYGVEDISFNGLLNAKVGTQLRAYLDADMIRQIHFISAYSNEDFKRWISFPLPHVLYFIFREDDMLNFVYQYDLHTITAEDMRSIYQYEPDSWVGYNIDQLQEIAAHICKDIVKQYNSWFRKEKDRFRYLINRGILMSAILLIFPHSIGMGTFQTLKKLISDLIKFWEYHISEQISRTKLHDSHGNSEDFVAQFIHDMHLDNMDGLMEAMGRLNQRYSGKEQGIIRVVNDGFYMEARSHENILIDIYKDIRTTSLGYDYLTFRWNGLSSGEYNLFNLYARIFSLREKLQDFSSLIFLIDEADLSYHPRWQQEYVANLVSFLNHSYPAHQIQLIIATHSPIILSDVLKGNVVFLNPKGEADMENTFGANIYDLYRNGMFLGGGKLGIIGAYAVQKIEEAIKYLEECGSDQAYISRLYEIEKLADCIGEPVIRKMLTRRIDQQKERLNLNKQEIGENIFLSVQENLKKLEPEFLDRVADVIDELRGK
ncbi:MAG: AAA family ATPase [Candidatus Gastranaerophilales bacterium]|nr:AAA family ATPase [Candidatus Gastranaerophilales bacterium]